MAVVYNGTTYYYATNIQGDVVAILNASGTAVVTYTYDAWGNILTTTGTLSSTLGTHNPLRYRGYVYDPETGLYYLQSRYYNPQMGRFLNADSFASTGQGILGNNMFAYCLNNPVSYADPSGYDAVILLDEDGPSHIGILVQDKHGVWWHYYWGADPSYVVFCVFGFDVKPLTWWKEYTGEISLQDINAANQFTGDYEKMQYLPGDFSNCFSSNETSKNYNLFSSNCSQVSLSILSKADTKYRDILLDASSIILPSHAFLYTTVRLAIKTGTIKKYIAKAFDDLCGGGER